MEAAAVYYDTLARRYPQARRDQVLEAVVTAVEGASLVGVSRLDPTVLATAEASLRVALGLDEERARTDPEQHLRRRNSQN